MTDDEPYGDWTMTGTNPATLTQLRSFELGLAVYETGSNVRYFRADHLGTTRRMSDSAGVMTSSPAYTAFGEVVSAAAPTVADRYRYVGGYGYQAHFADAAAGDTAAPTFLHVGHRYYDPASGRFLQRDPIGIEGGSNVYTYVRNHPPLLIDPQGLDIWDDLKDVGGIIGGIGAVVVGFVSPTPVNTIIGIGGGLVVVGSAGSLYGRHETGIDQALKDKMDRDLRLIRPPPSDPLPPWYCGECKLSGTRHQHIAARCGG